MKSETCNHEIWHLHPLRQEPLACPSGNKGLRRPIVDLVGIEPELLAYIIKIETGRA
jgi:hypothetical protein